MPEAEFIPKFLKSFASENDFTPYDCLYGAIELNDPFPIQQSSGAVYGIWAKVSAARKLNVKEIPGYRDWYPVYWGIDISPVSRIKAHVQGHKNGNIKLRSIPELKDAQLIFGAILVSESQIPMIRRMSVAWFRRARGIWLVCWPV